MSDSDGGGSSTPYHSCRIQLNGALRSPESRSGY